MAIVRNDVADKNECKNTRTDLKPLHNVKQTKPQESRARKLENGIALKMTKIAFKFKTRTVDYNTLQESVAKIGHSNHIYKYVPRFHRRQDKKKIQFKRERFIPAFLTMEKYICKTKLHFNTLARAKKPPFNQIFFFGPVSRQLKLIKMAKRAFPT